MSKSTFFQQAPRGISATFKTTMCVSKGGNFNWIQHKKLQWEQIEFYITKLLHDPEQ